MAQDNGVIKGVSWYEVLTFTKIFKSSRIARQGGMLGLGLALLVMLFLGGWIMDRVWSFWGGAAMPGEILLQVKNKAEFEKTYDDRDALRLDKAAKLYMDTLANRDSLADFLPYVSQNSYLRDAFNTRLFTLRANSSAAGFVSYDDIINKAHASNRDWLDILDDAMNTHAAEMKTIDKIMDDIYKTAEKNIDMANLPKHQARNEKEKLNAAIDSAWYGVTLVQRDFLQRVQQIEGMGIFEGLAAFERDGLYNAMLCVGDLNFFGGLKQLQEYLRHGEKAAVDVEAQSGMESLAQGNDKPGVIFYCLVMLGGILWLITSHPVYAAVFALWCMIIWSIFGGAVYRMAAFSMARGEKLSMSAAVRFSLRRFLNFFGAPLIPLAVVAFIGVFIFVLSLLGNIPFAGPLAVSILCGLFIFLGLVMSLILVGFGGVVWLQYPTIASDGTDAFGSVSDSYDHFFHKPFRTMFLGAVAFVYGVIVYMILRLFVFAGLLMVHRFVKLAIFTGGQSLGSGADRLDVIWAEPTFWNLYGTNYIAAGWWESVCAGVIGIWVNLLLGVLAAYLITYLASSSTAIHFILRNECESTNYDCIYMENEDDLPLDVKPAEKPQEETSTPETPEEPEEEPMPDGC